MNNKRMLKAVLAAAGLVAALNAQALGYGFDTGAQGWTTLDGGDQVWRNSGGNAGGFLEVTDSTGDDFLLLAPAAALGNWSGFLGGQLSFEARNVNGDTPDWAPFGQVTLVGAGGLSLMLDIAAPDQPAADGQWHRYSVTLSAAQWGPSLATVLGDLTSLTIKGEFHAGVTEVVGIDNITVTAVPEPSTWGLFVAGLLAVSLLKRRRGD